MSDKPNLIALKYNIKDLIECDLAFLLEGREHFYKMEEDISFDIEASFVHIVKNISKLLTIEAIAYRPKMAEIEYNVDDMLASVLIEKENRRIAYTDLRPIIEKLNEREK